MNIVKIIFLGLMLIVPLKVFAIENIASNRSTLAFSIQQTTIESQQKNITNDTASLNHDEEITEDELPTKIAILLIIIMIYWLYWLNNN